MAAGLAPSLERVVELVDRLTQKYGEQVASKIAEYVERIANWIDKTDWAKVARDVGEFVDRIGGVEGSPSRWQPLPSLARFLLR